MGFIGVVEFIDLARLWVKGSKAFVAFIAFIALIGLWDFNRFVAFPGGFSLFAASNCPE